jgi:hypothetical protein
LGDAGKELNADDERMRAMLLDWSQRVETWARTKAIADRAMGSFVADKVFPFCLKYWTQAKDMCISYESEMETRPVWISLLFHGLG